MRCCNYVHEILSSRLQNDQHEVLEIRAAIDLHVAKLQIAKIRGASDEALGLKKKIREYHYEFHCLKSEIREINSVLRWMSSSKQNEASIR